MKIETLREGRVAAGGGEICVDGVRRAAAETVSLCSLTTGEEVYGIDTKKIREVLGKYALRRIPLAPKYVAGVLSNRGEALTTVDLRALLGLEKRAGEGAVLVLEQDGEQERYGLMVDAVGGVVTVSAATLEANPSTLGARGKALFDGAYKLQTGLMVRLDTLKLHPSRLREVGLFQREAGLVRREQGDLCEGWKKSEETK